MNSHTRRASLSAIAVFISSAVGASAATEFLTLPAGAVVSVQIGSPLDGAVVPGASPVAVSGNAILSSPLKDTTVVYIVDRSDSMDVDSGEDCTGDGVEDSRYRCAQEAIKLANQAAASPTSAVSLTGLSAFAWWTGELPADVDYAPGEYKWLAAPNHDGDGNGTFDFAQAVDDLPPVGGFTDFGRGVGLAAAIFGAYEPIYEPYYHLKPLNTNSKNILVFLSDGFSTEGSLIPNVGLLPPGTIIKAIALGEGARCSVSSDIDDGHGDLGELAAFGAPGSSCVQTGLSGAANTIIDSISSTLSGVFITIDDSFSLVPSTNPALPHAGPVIASFSANLTSLSPGAHQICATAHASDPGGNGSVTDCHDFTLNAPPTVIANDASGSEGAVIPLAGSVHDPDSAPTISWSYAPAAGVDPGAVCTFTNPAGAATSITCSDDGAYTLTLTADDGVNPAVSDTASLTVVNVAPTLSVPGTTIDENGVASLKWEVVDPSSNDTFAVTLNWGEGPAETFTLPAGTLSFSRSHQYKDDNPTGTPGDTYSVATNIADDDGGTGSHSAGVTVHSVAPVVHAGVDSVIYSGRLLTVNASFTDVGIEDTHSATIEWGDGGSRESRPVAQGAGFGTLSGEHRYTELGLYTVNVCSKDDDTVEGCGSLVVEVKRLPVGIEIKPESLNIGSNGKVKAELLSAPDFPAATVRQETVRFGYTGFETAPDHYDTNLNKVEFHFDRTLLGIPLDLPRDSVLTLYLTGRLQDGTLFIGSDTVRVVN